MKIVAADKSVSIFHFGQPCLFSCSTHFYIFIFLVSVRLIVVVVSRWWKFTPKTLNFLEYTFYLCRLCMNNKILPTPVFVCV